MDQMHVQSDTSVNVWVSLKMNAVRDWIQNAHLPSRGVNIILFIEQIWAYAELILELNSNRQIWKIIIIIVFWKDCEFWQSPVSLDQGEICLCVWSLSVVFYLSTNSIPGWMTSLYPYVYQMCRHNTDTTSYVWVCVCACEHALRAFILT